MQIEDLGTHKIVQEYRWRMYAKEGYAWAPVARSLAKLRVELIDDGAPVSGSVEVEFR